MPPNMLAKGLPGFPTPAGFEPGTCGAQGSGVPPALPPAAVLLVCVFAPATGFAANIAANGLFGSDKVELVVFTPPALRGAHHGLAHIVVHP